MSQEISTLEVRANQALVAAGVMAKSDIQKEVEKFVPLTAVEVSDKDTRTEVHENYMALRTIRLDVQKASKAARADSVAFSKAVLDQEKGLVELITPVESKLKDNRDVYDDKIKAEKLAAKNRIANITKAISDISTAPAACVGVPSNIIAEAIAGLESRAITSDEFEEFADHAEAEKQKALGLMRTSFDQVLSSENAAQKMEEMLRQQEEQAAEIKHQQEALDQQKREAEQAESRRIEAEQAESRRIEQDKQREIERKENEERRIKAEEQHRIEAEERRKAQEAKRIADEKQAEAEAEVARLNEEKRIAAEAEAARIAESAKLAQEAKAAEEAKLAEEVRLAEVAAKRPDQEKLAAYVDLVSKFAAENMPDINSEAEKAVAAWFSSQIDSVATKVKANIAEQSA